MWWGAEAGGARAHVARTDLSSPPYRRMSSLRSTLMVCLALTAYWWVSKPTCRNERRASPLVHFRLDDSWELNKVIMEGLVPFRGHVGLDVGKEEVGAEGPIGWNCSPKLSS